MKTFKMFAKESIWLLIVRINCIPLLCFTLGIFC